ncbi:hypothetical protein H2202_007135 [Exophiala xenobiotica]|nr:hypothetical protein H2202_007135 [Exophiala xenobiotica]KAK5205889.1 hypothetical protein LTR41_008571 [Exophiala xenobiotica]KAK5217099.1 hypothetical protein LTR72_010095 [Exophiala xenobiotica]KAK5225382.1 hypothetical protein LTR47_009444 [Exophiala xenobiotica]KAK5249511.1 hypothetical protein LTS06_005587 [Exophiala xenobiotica]
MSTLQGKVITVTGAASGIGLVTTKLLASRGASLSLADINASQLEAVAQDIEKSGTQVIHTVVDVRKLSDVRTFIDNTVRHFGQLDGAVNFAGVIGKHANHATTHTLRDETDEEWEFIMDVNARGVFNCLREELRVMKSGASIVNAASVLALVGQAKNSIYCASKHAVAGLIRAAAKEEGENGIRINGVAPGFIDTPMVSAVEAANNIKEANVGPQSFKRKGKPEEIASVVAFLLGDESTFVTGAIWAVDGGWAC